MRKALFLLWVFVCALVAVGQDVTQGSLYAANARGVQLGACPLKNTAVNVEISGFVARVRVVQDFTNTFVEPIEAVYTFPLSQNGAVDHMTMTVGTRVIRGKVLKREEARQVYESAKSEGKTASLLDQERTNIFTQSVANIMPGESVKIEISYVETLKYEDGEYEFVFPMTVGPRYMPGSVTDAAKISPPIAAERAGHDISINVNLNAGVPVEGVRSSSHGIDQLNYSPAVAKVNLKGEKTIPNKDFVLRYDVTGKRIEDALIAHRGAKGGFFTLLLQPPDKIASEDRTPKEIVFVLDTSGSMSGFPIEKAKEAMKLSLDGLYPEDTFNLITFAGDTHVLFETPVPATQANLELAQEFLASRSGGGGTEMMKAIKTAFAPSGSKEHLRIVCFMTDAFVGNEDEIVAEIQRNPQARVFSFGIGNSVNRALLDKMAEAGRGEVEYVMLGDDGSKAAKRFYERVRSPLLTDLSIEWNGLPVADVYPSKLSDLFSAKPVIVKGRYTRGARGSIKLRGKVGGLPYERSIDVSLPDAEAANDSLASLWARQRIDELSSDALNAQKPDVINKKITDLGLEFGLMTRFTSFVAVEERIVNQDGKPVKVEVPVEAPDGVDMTKAGGRQWNEKDVQYLISSSNRYGTGSGMGSGSGTGSGSGSGYGSGSGSLPTQARSVSAGVMNSAMSQTVTVTGGGGGGGGRSEQDEIKINAEITTNISRKEVEQLPKGATFSSLLTVAPGVHPRNSAGGFQVDGASGSENVFVIDQSELAEYRTAKAKGRELEPVAGRLVAAAEPVYTEAAKSAKAFGEVLVEITVAHDGTIESAKAVSGPEELRPAAEQAALLSKFAPVTAQGRRYRLKGIIAYHFKSADVVEVSIRKMKAGPLTSNDRRKLVFAERMHVWLYAVVERIEKKASPTPNESQFVRDGRAGVELTFSSPVSSAVLARLNALGFEIGNSKGVSMTGTIPVEKLRELVDIDGLKYVMPRVM